MGENLEEDAFTTSRQGNKAVGMLTLSALLGIFITGLWPMKLCGFEPRKSSRGCVVSSQSTAAHYAPCPSFPPLPPLLQLCLPTGDPLEVWNTPQWRSTICGRLVQNSTGSGKGSPQLAHAPLHGSLSTADESLGEPVSRGKSSRPHLRHKPLSFQGQDQMIYTSRWAYV